jgi:hypothetical protein
VRRRCGEVLTRQSFAMADDVSPGTSLLRTGFHISVIWSTVGWLLLLLPAHQGNSLVFPIVVTTLITIAAFLLLGFPSSPAYRASSLVEHAELIEVRPLPPRS